MPVYDYRCENCGKTYDVFHKVREVLDDVLCPSCGSTKHKRLISAPSFSVGRTSDPAPSCSDGGCCGGSCGRN